MGAFRFGSSCSTIARWVRKASPRFAMRSRIAPLACSNRSRSSATATSASMRRCRAPRRSASSRLRSRSPSRRPASACERSISRVMATSTRCPNFSLPRSSRSRAIRHCRCWMCAITRRELSSGTLSARRSRPIRRYLSCRWMATSSGSRASERSVPDSIATGRSHSFRCPSATCQRPTRGTRHRRRCSTMSSKALPMSLPTTSRRGKRPAGQKVTARAALSLSASMITLLAMMTTTTRCSPRTTETTTTMRTTTMRTTTMTTTAAIRRDRRECSHHRRHLRERSRRRRPGLRHRRPSSTSRSPNAPNVARSQRGPPPIGRVLRPVRRRRRRRRRHLTGHQNPHAGHHHHRRRRRRAVRRRHRNLGVSRLRRGPGRRHRPPRASTSTSSPRAVPLRARRGPGRRPRPLRARTLTSNPRAVARRVRRGPGRRRRPLRARTLTSSPRAVPLRTRRGPGRRHRRNRARTSMNNPRAARRRLRLGPGRHRRPARVNTLTKSPRAVRWRPQTGSRRHLLSPRRASRRHQHPEKRRPPTRGWRSTPRCCGWACPKVPWSSKCRPTESTRLRSQRSPTRRLQRLRRTGSPRAVQRRRLHCAHRRLAPRCHNHPQRATHRHQRPNQRRPPTRECRSIRRCCAWVCLQARWPSRCRPTGLTRQRSRHSPTRIRVRPQLQPRMQRSGLLQHRPLAERSSAPARHLRAHRRLKRKLRAPHKTHAMRSSRKCSRWDFQRVLLRTRCGPRASTRARSRP